MSLKPAQNLLKESKSAVSEENHVYQFDEFRIDARKRQLTRAGEVVPLYSKAFDLLLVLLRNGDSDLTKDELLESVWPGQILEEANLSVSISAVRKALGERAARPRYIITIPGHGYRFVADLNQAAGLVIESESIAQITIDQETDEEKSITARAIEAGPVVEASSIATRERALSIAPLPQARRWRLLVPVLLLGVVAIVAASILVVRKFQHDRMLN